MTIDQLKPYLAQIHLPQIGSHKGQNGKVMVIGGSELFHAASQWSLLVVSRMVDMVFYSSVPSNNLLIHEAKQQFHNGIVIPREQIEEYINEADVVLIGPGMERKQSSVVSSQSSEYESTLPIPNTQEPTPNEWNNDTQKVTNYILSKYSHKKWVVDAGALQMADPALYTNKTILTPHQKEFTQLCQKLSDQDSQLLNNSTTQQLFSPQYPFAKTKQPSNKATKQLPHQPTILLKGSIDTVMSESQSIEMSGGNVGMTKGGTGDVLAGLVAGLYAFSADPLAVSVVASFINKKAGDTLYETVGPFFNSTDLANQIPKVMKEVFGL